MDILIGIVLALATLLALFTLLVWATDLIRSMRAAPPGVRAVLCAILVAFMVWTTFELGHAAGVQFGWWDERQDDCSMTVYFDEDDKPTESATVCPVQR